LRSQEVDDGFPVVCATGAANLMELMVQQLFQSLTTAFNSRVVEFNL
jgi:hypothetical protein